MTEYKTLKFTNNYDENNISQVLPILSKAGIETILEDDSITLNFDAVDIKYMQNQNGNINGFLSDTLAELLKIRSFSTLNGKTVFASFNKDKKVSKKSENKNKRLGYEYYQKQFSTQNNEVLKDLLNKIHCANSEDFLKKLPNNCIDLILTSPPYNFGINYNSTDDVNQWENYFNKLFVIFKECVRVLKDGGRIIVNIRNPMKVCTL